MPKWSWDATQDFQTPFRALPPSRISGSSSVEVIIRILMIHLSSEHRLHATFWIFPDQGMFQVTISPEEGTIAVWNNGRGIPVEIHRDENCWVPELIFGHRECDSLYPLEDLKTSCIVACFNTLICSLLCLTQSEITRFLMLTKFYVLIHAGRFNSLSRFPDFLSKCVLQLILFLWQWHRQIQSFVFENTCKCSMETWVSACPSKYFRVVMAINTWGKTAGGHIILAVRLVDVAFARFSRESTWG